MSPRYGVKLPPGWEAEGGVTYRHESGAVVRREQNQETGLIEWLAEAERSSYHGQDFHSALAAAAEEGAR